VTEFQSQFNAAAKGGMWESLAKAQFHIRFDTSIAAGIQRLQIDQAFNDLDQGVLSPRLEAVVSMAEDIVKGASW